MDLRTRILEAAARVYAETGYRGATTRRIAREAGVNEITLFRHFGSKDALLHEAISYSSIGTLSVGLPERPSNPRQELLEWARGHLAELRGKCALIRTTMGEIEEHPGLIPRRGSGPARAVQALARYLSRLKETGLARAEFDPAVAAPMLMGALFADAMGRSIMPDMYRNDAEAALRGYIELFLRGIGAVTRESAA